MNSESRVKKSFLNARMNLICYLASLIVAFFTRKIFLNYLGSDFIGLTGTMQSLLGFLNLAELGVGSAIGYVLYKPLYNDDKEKINEIISVFGYLYRCIGLVILAAGILLSIFLFWIFPDTIFSWGVIYLGFYAFLASSLLGYFVNYRMTLLGADQRNYIVTGYFQLTTLAKVIIQMILAIYIQSFYLYFFIEFLFGIINSIILNIKINKTYPWLESDVRLGKKMFKKYPEIGKYVKQLFVHKIAGFIQYQISPFLIYSLVSLHIVALYGNYTIITQKVNSLISALLGSTGAAIGNLISEGNSEKIYSVYKELLALQTFIASIISISVLFLINPFISLWLGEEYVLSSLTTFLICLAFFLELLRSVTENFKYGFGLFADTIAPIAEVFIYLASSISFGYFWGLNGVLLGPIFSLIIIVYIWKPYYTFKKGFHLSFLNYWYLFFSQILTSLATFITANYIFNTFFTYEELTYSWKNLILIGGGYFIIVTICCALFSFFISSGMRALLKRFTYKIFRNANCK